MEEFLALLPILIPFVLLELAVRIFCIVDVVKEDRSVKLLSKPVWVVLIVAINFAWIVYLVAGRSDEFIESK